MSEYWKSTPKYWCKHCSCYVRDTKLERQNHEATGKHQGALKRFLRDLHRGHEREERDKERAQQEIARLNGVVGGSSSSGPSGSSARNAAQEKPAEAQLKAQREQLAALGVAMPSDFRPEMAMPGEWTVTKTRVIKAAGEQQGEAKTEAKATGIRKREETEEQKEEEEAMRSLFKKPRRWGRDSKTMPQEGDEELDALLSGTIPLKQQADQKLDVVKKEESNGEATGVAGVKVEEDVVLKKEEDIVKKEQDIAIKEEPDTESRGFTAPGAEATKSSDGPDTGAAKTEGGLVVFKKRKPKGIRAK